MVSTPHDASEQSTLADISEMPLFIYIADPPTGGLTSRLD